MKKNIVIISSSLRANSNSDLMSASFKEGALEAGHEVEIISLKGKDIRFCVGCLSCQKTGKCVIKDDVMQIMKKAQSADVLVFASPVYYYSISGQLKTLFDRLNPLYSMNCRFKEVYFLSCAHENEKNTVEGSIKAVQGWVDCFEGAVFKKTVFAGGVGAPLDIKDHQALKECYETGKGI